MLILEGGIEMLKPLHDNVVLKKEEEDIQKLTDKKVEEIDMLLESF